MSLMRKEENKLVSQKGIKENPAACIFVASLNKSIQDAELSSGVYHHFEKWGTLLGVKVLKDWQKRPYAFVQFESEQDCRVALQEAPGTIIHGRAIRCEPARVNRSVCLISFSQPFNKEVLQTQLAKFGELEDITVVQPQNRFHYAFIKYKYRTDAITAYLTLKGHIGDINNQHYPWFVEWASNIDINNMYQAGHMMYRYLDKCSLFVGNLQASTCEAELRGAFEKYGTIENVHVIRKPYSQQSKNVFAFIRYDNESEAARAIEHENGKLWKDKIIRVCYRKYYHSNPYAYPSNETTHLPYKQMFVTEAKKRLSQQTGMGPYVFMPYSAYDLYYMGMSVEQQSSIHARTGTFYTTNVNSTIYHHKQPYYTSSTHYPCYFLY